MFDWTLSEAQRSALRLALPAVCVAVLFSIPLLDSDIYLVQIVSFGMMWAVLALGLNVVIGMTGQFAVCQAGFWGIGAYASALAAVDWGFPFIIAICFAVAITAASGALLGLIVLRLRGHYLAITTFGFGIVVYEVLANWIPVTHGESGLVGIPPPPTIRVFGLTILSFPSVTSAYYLMLLILCIGVVISLRLAKSRIRIAWNAIREDEVAAEIGGIPTVRYKLLAFAISAAYAGVAGSWWAHTSGVLSPDTFVFSQSATMLIMVVLGGLGSTYGVTIAGIVLTILPEYLRSFQQWQLIAYGAAVLLAIVFFPYGFAGLMVRLAIWARSLLFRERVGSVRDEA